MTVAREEFSTEHVERPGETVEKLHPAFIFIHKNCLKINDSWVVERKLLVIHSWGLFCG